MREDGLEGESGEWWEEDERKGGCSGTKISYKVIIDEMKLAQ